MVKTSFKASLQRIWIHWKWDLLLFVALVGIYNRGKGEKSKLLNVITLVYDYYMLLLN